jgi:hypothetical protein
MRKAKRFVERAAFLASDASAPLGDVKFRLRFGVCGQRALSFLARWAAAGRVLFTKRKM